MLHRDLKDPRLGFVTVTSASFTRDLRYAKVFISVLGDEAEQVAAMDALRGAAGYIRGEFARRARLRIAPELSFRKDEGVEHGARVYELLQQVKAETVEDLADTA